MSVLTVQQRLKEAGFDPGPLDGQWGPRTSLALDAALGLKHAQSLAWGLRVSPEFRVRVFKLCDRLNMVPDYLMACMAFETGETFSPRVKNGAGSGATGLIQFMPSTARSLGTSTEALAKMTDLQQLDYVESYFRPYKDRLTTLSDHYMAILWPAAIGRPESHKLWTKANSPTTYRQNAGLDANRNHVITKAEAAAKVQAKLKRGILPSNCWRLG